MKKFFIISSLIFGFIACEKEVNESSIVGKWGIESRISKYFENNLQVDSFSRTYSSSDKSYFIVEFKQDKSYLVNFPNNEGNKDETGTYTSNGNLLIIQRNGDSSKNNATFSISENKLTIKYNEEDSTRKDISTEVFKKL